MTTHASALGTYEWPDNQGWYDFYEVCCFDPEPEGCTLTQGFWKTHGNAWPVSGLTLGGMTYTHVELMNPLWTPARGDKSMILAHQLIAAMLNEAAGASPADALADAKAWMDANARGALPYATRRGAAAGEASTLADALAAYNEGATGPGHCDDTEDEGGEDRDEPIADELY
jgi:hypothetical protein